MYGRGGGGKTLNFLYGIGHQHRDEIITVVQALAHACGNGVDVLHHAGVLQTNYIGTRRRVYEWRTE